MAVSEGKSTSPVMIDCGDVNPGQGRRHRDSETAIVDGVWMFIQQYPCLRRAGIDETSEFSVGQIRAFSGGILTIAPGQPRTINHLKIQFGADPLVHRHAPHSWRPLKLGERRAPVGRASVNAW